MYHLSGKAESGVATRLLARSHGTILGAERQATFITQDKPLNMAQLLSPITQHRSFEVSV